MPPMGTEGPATLPGISSFFQAVTFDRTFAGSLEARGAESAAPVGALQRLADFDLSHADRRNDKLGNSHALFDRKPGAAQIDQGHADLAPVVRINGPRGVGQGDAMLARETRA